VFLSGTILNVVAVIIGTTIGVLAATRIPGQLQESVTTAVGLFVAVLATSMALTVFNNPAAAQGDVLAVLGGLLIGVVVGESLRIHDRLESLGAWFQQRLARGARPSQVAQAFVTASLVYIVGPLTIIGSLDNGLRGDPTLLVTKSLLDGITSLAFAAALGPGVYLAALSVLVVQGTISAGAFLLRDILDPRTLIAITSVGGVILVGMALRLLELKAVRVANLLPALIVAPVLLRLTDLIRIAFG
jgi:uncharacterized membrane protein YqgA involved in biofilm formation